ncbi:MAG: ATP-dependent DNA helicase RecG [Bacteroidales bacterium]|nr:ATP-dependent DNA helicase RecG [Bacteroidales bacterium]
MQDFLDQDIKFLPGVGPKRAELLNRELNIYTFRDLLYYFPYKYVDRTRFYTVREISPDFPMVQIRGTFVNFSMAGKGNSRRLIGLFSDGTGVLEVVWFRGLKWITQSIKPGKEYVLFGKPTLFAGKLNLVHPEIEDSAVRENQVNTALQAFYSTTEKLKENFLSSRAILKLLNSLIRLASGKITETLPLWLVEKYRLMPLYDALVQIHFPENADQLARARYRLKFEELFYIQLNILLQKNLRSKRKNGFVFSSVGEFFNTFYHRHLPFELTGAQKRVLKEIRKDLGSGFQMNRLLQGDVGSGKTLVALMSMLLAIDNGYQACLMAPTEILANQHYKTLCRFLGDMPVNIELLTGSTKPAVRKRIHQNLRNGTLHILVGTHALIEESVQFSNLGLVIIDEQHRFGVAQRARLWEKNIQPPHVLVMTATPIPRTLAMTLYGDLDISVIDEFPPGRLPVKTIHLRDSARLRLFGFLKKEIEKGRQVFVVYPLISESEKMDYKDLEDGYESFVRAFPPPRYSVACIHGRMKSEEKEETMQYFARGQIHILIATTVIEVGMDVPNASVMVIESAERFGLSQLHQLRGRVGRGSEQSYCILVTRDDLAEDALKRIEIMTRTSNGFEIAEEDLRLRGPGDLEGTRQSGIPFELKIADLAQDGKLLQYVRDIALEILKEDPLLDQPRHQLLKAGIRAQNKNRAYWGGIS